MNTTLTMLVRAIHPVATRNSAVVGIRPVAQSSLIGRPPRIRLVIHSKSNLQSAGLDDATNDAWKYHTKLNHHFQSRLSTGARRFRDRVADRSTSAWGDISVDHHGYNDDRVRDAFTANPLATGH